MSANCATDIVVLCENRLGWVADPSKELWRARMIAASKLNRKIAADKTGLLTWQNLELAVEYLYRQRHPIQSPIYLTYVVADALRFAAEQTPVKPITVLIDEAIATEQAQPISSEQQSWLGQLVRAQGRFRQETYDEWLAARGHLLHAVAA